MPAVRDVFEFLKEIGVTFTEEEKLFVSAMAQISGELMAYRKRHNLSQADLARLLGMSQPMISKIESGQNVSIKTLAKIAAKLGGNLKISLGIFEEPAQVSGMEESVFTTSMPPSKRSYSNNGEI